MRSIKGRHLSPRSGFGLIVLAGSAGALQAYRTILRGITPEFPAAVTVSHHILQPRIPDLVGLLQPYTGARVSWAVSGAEARPGEISVVPPGKELTLADDGTFHLSDTKAPFACADALLASLALRLGPRGLGVILSGAGSDGSRGAAALRAAGGTVIVQDRQTSTIFGMPRAAMQLEVADFVFPLDAIAPALVALATHPGAAVLLNRGKFEVGAA